MTNPMEILRNNKDSIANTIIVATFVSLFCAVLVSATAVLLKPKYVANRLYHGKHKNVIRLIDSIQPVADIEKVLTHLQIKFVDLHSGNYVEGLDPATFDVHEMSKDPEQSIAIPEEFDIAGIGRRATIAMVYVLSENDQLKYIILPVYGQGMWSTIYGYLALEADANTIAGLYFYEHGETPGIGDRIEDPEWLRSWQGKQIYAAGDPAIRISKRKSTVDAGYTVDNISGATVTSHAVEKMIHYWLGENGFQPFLEKVKQRETEHEN